MPLMRAIDPAVFVEFKRWIATAASNRPASKRSHDLLQADIVAALLKDDLLPAAYGAAQFGAA